MCQMLILNSLKRKIEQAEKLISETMARYEKPFISTSWGKDSTVVMQLVHNVAPAVPLIFMDSGYNMPDTYAYRDAYLKTFRGEYHEIPCPHDYLALCLKYGLPGIDRTQAAHTKVIGLIKSEPIEDYARSQNYDCCLWGIRADETQGRRYLLTRRGLCYTPKDGIAKCCPIGYWTTADVWNYIDAYGIPYNALYDKELKPTITRDNIKNSGWLTTDKAERGRIVWLKRFYPEIYARLKEMAPSISNYV